MNQKRGIALVVGLLVFFALLVAPFAQALSVTDPNDFPLQSESVLISAFSLLADKKGVEFIEINNHTTQPVKLTDWKIRVSFGGDVQDVLLPNGWLLEDEYQAIGNSTVGGADIVAPLASIYEATSLSVIDPSGVVRQFVPLAQAAQADATKWYQRSTSTSAMKNMFEDFTAKSATASSPKIVRSTGGLYQTPFTAPPVQIVEIYPYASDCSPFDESVLCGDYVKFYNPTTQPIDMSDYALRTDSSSLSRTSSNTFSLENFVVQPGEYKTKWTTDSGGRISLTNSGGYIWLEDNQGITAYKNTVVPYASAGSAQQGFAWAQNDYGNWDWTSMPSPLGMNTFPVVLAETVNVLAECPAGKYRNPETNRCRTIEEAVNALATCPEGQTRNPDTNRCRSITTSASASLTLCKEGQERNPETNRCRSIASAVAELMPCDEGYERNPATNRCRKLLPLTTPASVAAITTNPDTNTALPWVLLVAGMGVVGYGVFEWRSEITGGFSRLMARFKK